MNPIHSAENVESNVVVTEQPNEMSKIPSDSKDASVPKGGDLSVGQDLTEGTLSSIYPKNISLSPKLRGKLKPEQSYKKETKASRLGKSTGRWTHQEHVLFIEGLKIFGKNWKKVESYIGTRTGTQIRSHAQKFFNRIKKEHQTDDPSKYVIDNMGDDDVKRIILEHLGEESSSDTPEVLFSITKEKSNKRKREEVSDTPRSLASPKSAFKSFKRSEMDMIPACEDSKVPTILQKPV